MRVVTSPPNSQGYLLLALLGACERLGGLPDLDDAALVPAVRPGGGVPDRGARRPAARAARQAQLLAPDRLLDGGSDDRRATRRRPRGDTVAVTAVSADGTAVSLIQSLFHSFGSQVLEPGTGVILHNRGSMFSADPASPNHPAPGKRPAHTLMPVVVEHADGRISAHGAMGGRAQPQIHLQLLRQHPRRRDTATGGGGAAARRARRRRARRSRAVGVTRRRRDGALPRLSDEVGHAMICTLSPDGSLAAGVDPRSDGAVTPGGSVSGGRT